MITGPAPGVVARPGEIGTVSQAAFVGLPNPSILFRARARRLLALATGSPFPAFLEFMAAVARAQDVALAEVPPLSSVTMTGSSPGDGLPLAREPILAAGDWHDVLHAIAGQLATIGMPAAAASALRTLAARPATEMAAFASRVLDRQFAPEEGAETLFLTAALQVAWTRRAASIPASAVAPRETIVCPICGATPAASLVGAGGERRGLRFLVCSLCAAEWRHVRIKCTVCGSTKGIAYHGIEGRVEPAKAEACAECRAYTKIIYAEKDTAVEPLADDLGSLELDVLMSDDGWRRAHPNPFLMPGLESEGLSA